MATKREEWVDIAKGFAIIAVVLGHISYQYPDLELLPVSTIIAWLWHVPVFFMIGGFFLKDDRLAKPATFIKGKIRSLYLLILYIYIPFTLLHNVMLDVGFYDTAIEYGGKHVSYWTLPQFLKEIVCVVCLAGREPIVGAMWFVYVLFMALCYLSIVRFAIVRITPPPKFGNVDKIQCIVLFAGAVLSSLLTNVFDFTIPRFNNVFTAAWLIYVGQQLVQRFKVKFDCWFMLAMSVMTFYSFAVLRGAVRLNHNVFDDVVSLTASTLSALYIVAFLSKKCKGWLAGMMAMIGRDSFYIMGLHFFVFKICSLLLNLLIGTQQNVAVLNPEVTNIFLYVYYAIGGVFIPLVFMRLWRRIINKVLIWISK